MKDNSGSLFKNDKKTTEHHPDYTGSININGSDFWLSAWVNPGKDGKKAFMKLSAKPKTGAAQSTKHDEEIQF